MEEQENTSQHNSGTQITIPPVFQADATGEPFKNCVMCGKNLLEPGTRYMIEKAFRYDKKHDVTETLLEYAICSDCHAKIATSLSQESMQRMRDYFSDNFHFTLRNFLLQGNNDISKLIDTCAIKGKALKDCNEYQLCCECEGDKIVLSQFPLMFCDEAMEEMQALLSEKTKEELDRFHDEFLGIPPEWRELLKERTPVFV